MTTETIKIDEEVITVLVRKGPLTGEWYISTDNVIGKGNTKEEAIEDFKRFYKEEQDE